MVASVPDLICVLDTETGEPVTTEMLRYGLRVTVLGAPVRPALADARGPRAGGPALLRLRPRLRPDRLTPIDALALGAALLGSGGGGDIAVGASIARRDGLSSCALFAARSWTRTRSSSTSGSPGRRTS